MSRIIFLTVLVVTMAMLATTLFAVEYNYLPLVPGQTNRYAKIDDHHVQILRYLVDTGSIAEYRTDVCDDGVLFESLSMTLTRDGDGNIYCHGGCWCPTQMPCQLDPPELMILAPLEVGKTWDTYCNTLAYGPVHFESEVLRFEKVTVPAGTFECYVVERRITTWTWTYSSYEWYSSRAGIVKFNWPWAGTFALLPGYDITGPNIHTTGIKADDSRDHDTWGGIKNLYR